MASNARYYRTIRGFFTLILIVFASHSAGAQTIVQKTAEPFQGASWHISDDSSATGQVKFVPDAPAALGATVTGSLQATAHFDGKGFEFLNVVPTEPLVIPGVMHAVAIWVRADGKFGWALQFKDGWGRTETGAGKLETEITKGANGTWQQVTFPIPGDWVMPLTITGVLVHNWDSKTEVNDTAVELDQLQVQTDISGVDDTTGALAGWRPPGTPADPTAAKDAPTAPPLTPLLAVNLAGSEEHNVFVNQKPDFLLTAHNWRPKPAAGQLSWQVEDASGVTIKSGTQALRVDDNFALDLFVETPKYGVYELNSKIAWDNGKTTESNQSFAEIPVPRTQTDAEKDASPYGLNVLSARGMMVETFRKAGIDWYRDYGFDYSWMTRAKGADKSYGGWPWYPKIVARYENSGARVLACLKTSIKPPLDGKTVKPDLDWTREIVGILTAFPYLKDFELDNEYDLGAQNAKAELAVNWANYRDYHKKFGQLVQILGDGSMTAVENGRPGIFPDRVAAAVKTGDFADIDVINSHHYCGTDAPELNVVNNNTEGGYGGQEATMTFYDRLRAVKAAGSVDGKARQHWLTEFGWDTKAGHIVTPQQQAAYLSRGYMLALAAGTSKAFWFFDLDSPTANQFFDGCGLVTADQEPKLSFAAFAGLTQILPNPEFVGTISAGDGTWGYLFRDNGKLVAALWTLADGKGPTVDFGSGQLYDEFANPLPGTTARLGMAPVFAVGVDPDSMWAHQANYELTTPQFVTATAGDTETAQVTITNSRIAPISGTIGLQVPAGWTAVTPSVPVNVPASGSALVRLTYRVGSSEELGEKLVTLSINEGGPVKTIPVRVQIGDPLVLSVSSLGSVPGEAPVTLKVTNLSTSTLDGMMNLSLPASWSTPATEIPVKALAPGETRQLSANVTWSADWKPAEAASAEFKTTDGRSVAEPIIPGQVTIGRAPALKMDGDLASWPASMRLPDWVLGSSNGPANAALYLGWAPEGLYIAADVHDSKATVPDPKSFWFGDVLELFLDTRDKKTARNYEAGDHQFWLVPQPDQNRVYVGQWKRNAEIEATGYDLPGITSACVRKPYGYTMELLLPAALLKEYRPQAGGSLGVDFNLTVKSQKLDREVFWPASKGEVAGQPGSWGTVRLGDGIKP